MDFRDGTTEYGIVPRVDSVLDDDYSLEEILAEYGGSREQQIMRDVEREVMGKTAAAQETAPPAEPAAPTEKPQKKPHGDKSPKVPKAPAQSPAVREKKPKPPRKKKAVEDVRPEQSTEPRPDQLRQTARDKLLAQAVDLEKLEREIPSPRPITLQDVVGDTVSAVMEEQEEETFLKPKQSLFSRRKLEETE